MRIADVAKNDKARGAVEADGDLTPEVDLIQCRISDGDRVPQPATIGIGIGKLTRRRTGDTVNADESIEPRSRQMTRRRRMGTGLSE